ncbi:hypothetical protein M0R45_035628 [Rubus argutus]|uniref:Uncharacterized protein n=1 Tax=Rubus argutus TaxID=59490 RepID=A0AAW1VXI7_RUBAR
MVIRNGSVLCTGNLGADLVSNEGAARAVWFGMLTAHGWALQVWDHGWVIWVDGYRELGGEWYCHGCLDCFSRPGKGEETAKEE